MSGRDRLLAVTVAVLWGLNFVAVRLGLDEFPPIFFAALRYLVLAVPVVLLVRRPPLPYRWLVLYGLAFGVVQFGLLFLAISQGMPSGLSSVLLQAAAPITMALSVLLLHERPTPRQLLGTGIAAVGIAVIGGARLGTAAALPLVLTLLAALGWAVGNLALRKACSTEPLHFVLWMSVVPPLPLLALSAVTEGPTAGWRAVSDAATGASGNGIVALVALVYVVVGGTVVGATLWTGLLARNPATEVAPFSMLVPIVGILGGFVVFHEQLTTWTVLGIIAVVGGLLVGLRVPAAARRERASV